MNKDQEAYLATFKVKRLNMLAYSFFASVSAYIYGFNSSLKNPDIIDKSIEYLALGLFARAAFKTVSAIDDHITLALRRRSVSRSKNLFPLDHAEEVIFQDEAGLDYILEKTSLDEKKEWCTMYHAKMDNDVAIIHDIDSFETIQSKSLVFYRGTSSIRLKRFKDAYKEYDGIQHFHLSYKNVRSSVNFYVPDIDRASDKNRINFTSFLHKGNPELIGFNYLHLYLPVDAFKRKFERATKQDVLRYLS